MHRTATTTPAFIVSTLREAYMVKDSPGGLTGKDVRTLVNLFQDAAMGLEDQAIASTDAGERRLLERRSKLMDILATGLDDLGILPEEENIPCQKIEEK